MKHNLNATALPAQAEVAAELEGYLIKMARPATLSEAYRALADRFYKGRNPFLHIHVWRPLWSG